MEERGVPTGVSRHVPELDGLRGVAVAAVVAFHLADLGNGDRHGVLGGGWLGVDAFFTLSGYLITTLLLGEVERTGRLDLGSFWRRRIRRLQPAALVVVAFCLATVRWWSPAGTAASVRGQALGAIGALANWQSLWAHHPYAAGVAPSAFEHFWSLAVEEQFYVVWPLVVVALVFAAKRFRAREIAPRRLVLGAALVGAAGSWLLVANTPLQRGYLGTDTRAGSILAGAALACVLPAGRRLPLPRAALWSVRVGVVGCGVALAMLWAGVGWPPHASLGLVLPLNAVCVVGLLVGVAVDPGALVSRGLRRRPLTVLGRVSYGVYLWHWPIFVLVTPERLGASALPTDVVRLGLVALATALSWVLVEWPIRTGRAVRRTIPALATTWALILTMTVGFTAMVAPAPAWATANGALVVGPGGRAPAARTAGLLPTAVGAPSGARDAAESQPVTGPPRVLVVGDSLPTSLLSTGDALPDLQQGVGHLLEQFAAAGVTAASTTITSCPVLDEAVISDGSPQTWCQDSLRRLLPQAMEQFHPNVIVWYARSDAYPVQLASGAISDPISSDSAAALLQQRYASRISWFASFGARVILVSPGPNADGHNAGDERGDSFRSMLFLDRQLAAAAAANQPAVIGTVRMADLLCPGWPTTPGCPDKMPSNGTYRGDDGIHFTSDGAGPAGAWLVQQVLKIVQGATRPD